MWIVAGERVQRLDLATTEPLGAPIAVGKRPSDVIEAFGSAWTVNSGDGTVTRIDPRRGRSVGAPIRVGREPARIAAGGGFLWVSNRRDVFRASPIMLDRARERDNIEFLTPFVADEFVAGEDGSLHSIALRNPDTGETRTLDTDGAFIAIGHQPNSEIVRGIVDLDDNGYVVTEGKSTRTNIPGIFAAGDLVDHTYRQAVTAAGSGCQSALDAEWYLRDNPAVPTPPELEGVVSVPESHWAQPAR